VLPLLPQQIKYDEAFTQNENFDNTKCTVLLADDEENNAILIQEILNEIGIQIIHAQNGQEVLNIIEKHTDIQLILMDIQMPHMNGIDAFTELRKRGVKIPVIAISAFCSKSDIDNFLKIGFDSFLPKPIIEEEFIALVSKLLKRKQPSNKNPKAQSIFHKLFFKKR